MKSRVPQFIPFRTVVSLSSYLFEPTCLFVETLPRLFILPVFPFLRNKDFPHFFTYHFILCDYSASLSSSGFSDPYHFGGTRSVLSWEMIVQYPRYKLRGQIRLKDTTLSLGSDLLLNHLFALQVCFLHGFSVSIFKRTGELHLLLMFIATII